ncbi:hypothetical protein GCK32_012436, partial [Trichostrongylus colubriformis]
MTGEITAKQPVLVHEKALKSGLKNRENFLYGLTYPLSHKMSWQYLFILVFDVVAVSLWMLLQQGYMTNLTPGKVKDDQYEVDDPFDRCILPKLDPWESEIMQMMKFSDTSFLDIMKRKRITSVYFRETKEEVPVEPNSFDVYVILLDSTAASQARRNLPQTLQFFEKSMDAVTFPHVNKVGLNSRPCAVALWFGKSMEQVDRSLFGLPSLEPDWTFENFCSRYMDNETSLFKDYANRGYKTLFAEDWMKGTLNWPQCRGFNKQPTDHYM